MNGLITSGGRSATLAIKALMLQKCLIWTGILDLSRNRAQKPLHRFLSAKDRASVYKGGGSVRFLARSPLDDPSASN